MTRFKKALIAAAVLLGVPLAVLAQTGTNVNAIPGSVWTYLGPTLGASWVLPVGASFGWVPHNAALAALSTAAPQVYRAGFYAPGDGGGALYTKSASACPLAGGVGDNGSQVKSIDGGCWLADFGDSTPTPLIWGARGDGTANDSATFQAAVNARQGDTLWLGEHIYRLNTGIVSAGKITIVGVGGGQGFYTPGCTAGIRAGAANIDLLTLQGADSRIDKICMDTAAGITNTAGRGIFMTVGSDRSIVSESSIYGACIAFDISGNGTTQLIGTTVRNSIILPAANPNCRAARIGASTTGGNTVDNFWLFNNIYCGADDGSQSTKAVGVEFLDAGGQFYNSTPPYACSYGMKITPGNNQMMLFGFFYGGLGDSSGLNDLLIDALASNSVVFANAFTGTWTANNRSGPSLKLQNTGNSASVSGTRFVGHRAYASTGNLGPIIDVSSGKFFRFSNSAVCPAANNPGPAIWIHGDARSTMINDNSIGFCDHFGGDLTTGIRINGSDRDLGMVRGNDFLVTGNPIELDNTNITSPFKAWAAIIEQNRGLESPGTTITAAATITLPMSGFVLTTGTTVVKTMLNSWTGRTVYLIPQSAGGFNWDVGGTTQFAFCNGPGNIPQNSMGMAYYVAGNNCWVMK